MTARTVVISARPVIEAPLRAEIATLRAEVARHRLITGARSTEAYEIWREALEEARTENKQLRTALRLIADVGPHGSAVLCRHTAAKALAQAKESS